MASHRLPNYLRTHRKQSALSQEELAYLLGVQSGAKVCRYEGFIRQPGLETALALEAIFRRPSAELFAGLFQKIEGDVRRRAKKLLEKEKRKPPTPATTRKCQVLQGIVDASFNHPSKRS